MHLRLPFLLLLPLLAAFAAAGQTTTVTGRVFDSSTGAPMPYVTVLLSGDPSVSGTMTALDGTFRTSTPNRPGMLQVSFVGYATRTLEVRRGIAQNLNVALEPQAIELGAAVVRPDKNAENPARPLMDRVIEAKERNRPESAGAVTYRTSTRIEVDLNDLSRKQVERWYWGPFAWVFDHMDSSEVRPALPFIMSEAIGTVRKSYRPNRTQATYEATRLSGLDRGENMAELNSRFPDVNLYDNRLLILDRAFTSPLHDRSAAHYRYYIIDTLSLADRPCFHLAFVPRRKGELTFEGELWIDTLTLGLARAEAKVSDGANLNWIRGLRWTQEYGRYGDAWQLEREYALLDLSLTRSSIGAYMRRTTVNTEIEVFEALPDSVWTPGRDLVLVPGASKRTEEDWSKLRVEPLLPRESLIYWMVDSVQSMPAYRIAKGTGYFLGTGFILAGPLELGAWWSAWSSNPVEGNRYRIDLRTSNKFSKEWMPALYAAYGSLDGRWKGGASVRHVVRKTPRTEWTANVQRDLEQFGMLGFLSQGDLLASALQTNAARRLSEVGRLEGSVLHEFGAGFTGFVELRHRRVAGRGDLQFLDPSTGLPITSLITSEATLQLRYAFKERFVGGEFDRVSLGTEWPVLRLTWTGAFPGVGGSTYDYHRFTLDADDDIRLGMFGRIEWNAEAGMYAGTAPFALLEIVPVSGTFFSSITSFSLLNFYELVTDRWVRGNAEWHAEGLLFNHLPVLRRMQLREFTGIKAVVGGWSSRHEALLELPEGTSGLSAPYAEWSIGVENIFRFLKVEAVRAVAAPGLYVPDREGPVWGLRMGFAVEL